MNSIERLESVIQNKKWIKNDIGMGRIQCGKLIRDNDEVILLIAPSITNIPIRAKVQSILFSRDALTVFYDGEFCEEIEMKEFNIYKDYLTEDEWNVIFEDDSDLKLENMGMILDKEAVYIDVHENKYNYNKVNKEDVVLDSVQA